MRLLNTFALAAAVAVGLSLTLADTADARKAKKPASCAMVTGEGTGVGEGIARANATNSLDGIAKRVGGKRMGKAKTTCKAGLAGVVTTCQSSQRVCK